MSRRDVRLALNICTYKREDCLRNNLSALQRSGFFNKNNEKYYGRLHIFVVDNAAELHLPGNEFIHCIHNRNTGGSGGFQRGLEEIRSQKTDFTHVIFMDDDVRFELESFYLLFDFLTEVDDKNKDRPVAGRMFCMDQPDIQYTAAEKWNRGTISHVEFMRDIRDGSYAPGRICYDADADYGGWWFCCFPMEFARQNDILPFFIHCDDVEYGLRCHKTPIIIEGVQVWHETYDKRITPLMQYYDTRNPLFVNQIHHLLPPAEQMYQAWKEKITAFHLKNDWLSEYYTILAMWDFMKGIRWLKRIDPENYHRRLQNVRTCKLKNAVSWRFAAAKFRLIWGRRYEKQNL